MHKMIISVGKGRPIAQLETVICHTHDAWISNNPTVMFPANSV